MPIMAIYRSKDVTEGQYAPYEAFVLSQPVPPGGLLHQVAFDADGGLCVVDIWDNRAEFEAFTAEAINPNLERFGMTPQAPEILELTSLATHDGIDRFKLLDPTRPA
jgi:hypothetical protein